MKKFLEGYNRIRAAAWKNCQDRVWSTIDTSIEISDLSFTLRWDSSEGGGEDCIWVLIDGEEVWEEERFTMEEIDKILA